MIGRQDRIAQFRDDLAHLLTVVMALPADRREQPIGDDWTPKDVLAHIAAWDRELVRALDELLDGKRPSFITYDVDAFNARTVATARDLSWELTIAELRHADDALLMRMVDLTDTVWEHPSPYSWSDGTPITVASLFAYSYRGETHYRGHARELAVGTS